MTAHQQGLSPDAQAKEQQANDSIEKKCIRAEQPTYQDVVRHDPMLFVPKEWREAQLRDYDRWTRKFLFPTVKVLCIVMMWATRVVKRILPFALKSEKALNFLSEWFMKNCVSPETEEVIYRHFALESHLVNFLIRNTGDPSIPTYQLTPTSWEEMGDAGGMNVTLLHDCNILNLFIELGQSEKANLHDQVPLKKLDFSGLEIPELKIDPDESKRLINLDLSTSLYIMVMFLVFLLDEDTQDHSANSLNLDESLMHALANITGDELFRRWSPGPFANWIRWPLDPAQGLHKHILICEYAYTRLMQLKEQQESSQKV